MKAKEKYAQALDQLAQMRAAGTMSEGQYQVRHQALMKEWRWFGRPLWLRIGIALAGLGVFLWLLLVVMGYLSRLIS
jgi:hypothetical protein